jgi:hypothetical protein
MISRRIFFTLAAVACLSGGARGAFITVGSTASGGFGTPVSDASNLVMGYAFTGAGQSITIDAGGSIDIGAENPGVYVTGPAGLTLERSLIIGGFGSAYTPLEEELVDSGNPPPISDGSSIVLNVGALFGAFVPQSLVDTPGFVPFDSDSVAVGVGAASLFLVDDIPYTFTSTGAGVLYFGINESFVGNNSGSFSVEITAVPEPSSLALAGLGTLGLMGYVHNRRRASA